MRPNKAAISFMYRYWFRSEGYNAGETNYNTKSASCMSPNAAAEIATLVLGLPLLTTIKH